MSKRNNKKRNDKKKEKMKLLRGPEPSPFNPFEQLEEDMETLRIYVDKKFKDGDYIEVKVTTYNEGDYVLEAFRDIGNYVTEITKTPWSDFEIVRTKTKDPDIHRVLSTRNLSSDYIRKQYRKDK